MRAEGIERLKQALKWLKCGRKTLGLYFRTKDREWRWNMDYRKKNWCGKNEKSCGAWNEDQSWEQWDLNLLSFAHSASLITISRFKFTVLKNIVKLSKGINHGWNIMWISCVSTRHTACSHYISTMITHAIISYHPLIWWLRCYNVIDRH